MMVEFEELSRRCSAPKTSAEIFEKFSNRIRYKNFHRTVRIFPKFFAFIAHLTDIIDENEAKKFQSIQRLFR